MTIRPQYFISTLLAGIALGFAGCSTSDGGNSGASGVSTGGGSSGGSDVGGFQLSSISVPENFTWKINRPISFVFTRDIDFSSISLNSIAIRDSNNFPANGSFSFDPAQPRVVVFQPTCPVMDDFSDAGFQPGGKLYTIVVIGKDGAGGTSVQSSSGEELEVSQTRVFFTPTSFELSNLFEDLVSGAPQPVVRAVGSTSLNATYIEIGNDSAVAKRIYFERDLTTQIVGIPGAGDGTIPTGHPNEKFETGMPLNLYSDSTSRVAFVLEVNQPVNPAPTNINSSRIRLEAEKTLGAGDFTAVPTTVTLIRNCTTTGATLRIEPIGVLPQNVDVRIVVDATFEDLTGGKHTASIDNFGVIRTRNAGVELADELLEGFTAGATTIGSLEDSEAVFSVPRAIWGADGTLKPRFDFDGNGGPTGAFDFVVRPAGGTVIIDTTLTTVQDSNQSLQQTIINGRLDVRNFTVEAGGKLQLQGPNPMVINATGDVRIDGDILMVGATAKDVSGVATASFPEPGAPGNMGGGDGGDASSNTTSSSPRGDHGFGAFNILNLGGQGGESGFGADPGAKGPAQVLGSHPRERRGGGGGGGVFGPNQNYPSQPLIDPQPANLNGTNALIGGTGDDDIAKGFFSTGAISGVPIAQGGAIGPSPFTDGDSTNDFFGIKFDPSPPAGGQMLIRGELDGLHGGGGGGGGGDSIRSKGFPTPNFSNKTEDKGGAGGGGAGALLIRCLGDVTFGPVGKILAEGGDGARGQLIMFNNNFFVKSGASGGGGAGGHVVIEAGGTIDLGSGLDVISARGGQGGPGGKPASNLNNARGGNGGPGVVQLHTPNGLPDITTTQTLETAVVPVPHILLPNFGKISRARSQWIPLGGAVGDLPSDVTFLFEGTDVADGSVDRVQDMAMMDTNVILDLSEIVGPDPLTVAGFTRLVDEHTLSFDFVNNANSMFAMADFIYRDNPVLMRNFILELFEDANPATLRRYNIESVSVDPMDSDRMILSTTASGLAFSEFVGELTSVVPDVTDAKFRILPRFFQVVTNGISESLPTSSSIKILFEGTGRDALGNPDTSSILVPLTPDISDLSSGALLKPVEFFRFEVEFDIDAQNNGLTATSARPVLEFLRIPFKF